MSDAEVEAQALIDLEQSKNRFLGVHPDVEVPVVSRIRFIQTSEWAPVMAECLTEAGFPTAASGEGIPATPPDGQEVSWALAAYTCSAQYPLDPHLTRPLSEEQLRYIYQYLTQVSVDCMRDLGFDDVSTPPSMQNFIETYGQAGTWAPHYEAATQASPEVADAIAENCPQDPPGLFG